MELFAKKLPMTVSVTGEPCRVDTGVIALKTGIGLPIVNFAKGEVWPNPGLETVTLATFTEVRSVAGICAVRVVLFTKPVVLGATPFQRMVELAVKLRPVTVSVKAGDPADTFDGVNVLIAGMAVVVFPPTTWATVSTTAVPELTWPCSQSANPVRVVELTE